MRTAGRVAGLVVLWILAWGDASLANVASGVVVAGALLVAFPPRARGHEDERPRLHPVGALRLVAYVAGQLATSNYLVAREVVSRRQRIRAGVLDYELRHSSDEVVTLMANVIALSPGTMTVDAERDPAVIAVHFLLLDDVEGARRSLVRLERLCAGALGHPVPAATTQEDP